MSIMKYVPHEGKNMRFNVEFVFVKLFWVYRESQYVEEK